MGTTYEYTYEYEVSDGSRNQRNFNDTATHYSQRPPRHGVTAPNASRTSMMDSLVNLQHDRIWNKLYDPLELSKAAHETEIQVCIVVKKQRNKKKHAIFLFAFLPVPISRHFFSLSDRSFTLKRKTITKTDQRKKMSWLFPSKKFHRTIKF